MGLLNTRNLSKAKALLEKNRHKVGDMVGMAGEKLDKATGGKTSNVTSKAADAARKYSEGGVTHHGIDTPEQVQYTGGPVDEAEAKRRANESTAAAANAVKGAADAVTNMMNNVVANNEKLQVQQSADGSKGLGSSADGGEAASPS